MCFFVQVVFKINVCDRFLLISDLYCSISVDGSAYQSSTPQTPNSGQESGSSTQPASPPPLADYHPANWFRKEPQTPPFLRKKMATSTEDSRQERSADDSGRRIVNSFQLVKCAE